MTTEQTEGRGDDLTCQERMAELKRERAQRTAQFHAYTSDSDLWRLRDIDTELSRLRNEGVENEQEKALDAIRRQTVPSWLKSNTASPSHLPAREAIERAAEAIGAVETPISPNGPRSLRYYLSAGVDCFRHHDSIVDELLRKAAIAALQPLSQGSGWQCKARSANTGANDPQDCDWPVCGCDPYADKVIEALEESGRLAPPSQPEGVREALGGKDLADFAKTIDGMEAQLYLRTDAPREAIENVQAVINLAREALASRPTTLSRGLVDAADSKGTSK